MSQDKQALLKQSLENLKVARQWLDRSFQICSKIGVINAFKPEEFDAFETLTSRYARTTDLIINKIFHVLDSLELETGGTIIDVINRTHKRGLFTSIQKIREMKELRNEISHEYVSVELQSLFPSVLQFTPALFNLMDEIERYCQRF